MSATDGGPDWPELARYLKALASPVRLQILSALQAPKRSSMVRVRAASDRAGFSAGRVLTRSAVLQNVAVLEEMGLVTRLDHDDRYVVNQQMMVALVEELGQLARLRPDVAPDVEETLVKSPVAGRAGSGTPGPLRLVIAAGPREGDAFPLGGDGPWVIGRSSAATLRIDHDPHVSALHAQIVRDNQHHVHLEALPAATNPPLVNWAPVAPGRGVPLAPGDVIRVGSTRLVYQAGASAAGP